MRTRLSDCNKSSIVKRVIELEGRGWQCIHPIKSRTYMLDHKKMTQYYVTMEREGERKNGRNGWSKQPFQY